MHDAGGDWPDGIQVVQVRIVRPTDKLEEVVAFYRDGLGLPMVGAFKGLYEGVMLGLPGRSYHLAFIRHKEGSPCPAPSRDNLLVLYIPHEDHLSRLRERLERLGHRPVEPQNPYWRDKSITFEDPDGWRTVLCRTSGI